MWPTNLSFWVGFPGFTEEWTSTSDFAISRIGPQRPFTPISIQPTRIPDFWMTSIQERSIRSHWCHSITSENLTTQIRQLLWELQVSTNSIQFKLEHLINIRMALLRYKGKKSKGKCLIEVTLNEIGISWRIFIRVKCFVPFLFSFFLRGRLLQCYFSSSWQMELDKRNNFSISSKPLLLVQTHLCWKMKLLNFYSFLFAKRFSFCSKLNLCYALIGCLPVHNFF